MIKMINIANKNNKKQQSITYHRQEKKKVLDEQFEQCIRRIQQGDKNGLKDIYQAYISFIYHVVYQRVQNKENAEDITSEFFIKLWNIADNYQFGGKHKAWLATIARNMAIDFLRKNKREQLVEEIEEMTIPQTDEVESQVIEDISLQEALDILNEGEREVIHLKIVGDMTFKEIAEILKLPMGTVTWKYQNAIKKLRGCGYE